MAATRTDLTIIKGDSFTRTFTRYSEEYLNYRGQWSSLLDYEVDDVIVYKNAVYKCILDTTASQVPTNVTYWGTPDPYDYSSHTFEAKIRTDYNEEASIVDFTVAFATDGTDGKFRVSLTAAQTAALDFDNAVYDIEVTSGSTVWKESRGKIILIDEATK